MLFLLMVAVVELLQKCVAFIAENSPSHKNQDFVLIKEGIQARGLGYFKQAPVTVLSSVAIVL